MRDSLIEGLSITRRIEVTRDRSIDFMGEDCRVYATPELVRDIEMTSRDLLLSHLDEGEDSVGTRVAVDHMAATLLDMWVDVTVTIKEIKGRMVIFEVHCRDALEQVAGGNHNRFVVDVGKTAQRLRDKRAKVS